MSYVIAIANQKGGVAKTTTVASIAGAMARQGLRVLAMDLDAQADLTLGLGHNPAQVRIAMMDVFMQAHSIPEAIIPTNIDGLSLVPANAEMEYAERLLPARPEYEFILRQALRQSAIFRDYEIILLDCPPFLGAVTLNALTAADMLIIPTQPEYYSAHALRNMMATVRRIRSQTNGHLIYRILITMQDRRNRIHRTLSEQIQTTFGDGLLRTVIETDTKLRESSIAGLPISFYRSTTRSAFQYQALAEELSEYVKKAPQPTA